MSSHRDLNVWHRSVALTSQAYRFTNGRAQRDAPDLVRQVRRSLASIGANIAEGRVQSRRQFRRYLYIALGSAEESENHLTLLAEIGALEVEQALSLQSELAVIRRQLIKLLAAI